MGNERNGKSPFLLSGLLREKNTIHTDRSEIMMKIMVMAMIITIMAMMIITIFDTLTIFIRSRRYIE
jgi:hypothetical protein